MGTLPFTLPGCDQPATTRIPVYTPAPDGSGSSLDAVAYVCAEHAGQALTAIRAADLNAYPDHFHPVDPDDTRTCGYVYVFAAGGLADVEQLPADQQHPAWCDRQGCVDRREHRSTAMAVKPGPDDLTALTVRLVQLFASPTILVALSFIAEDPDDTTEQLLTLDQAVMLTYRIRTLVDRAKGRQA